jgi:signal transduction histidine kinase
VQAAIVLEQGSDAILTLTNDALVRLMTFTLLASVLAAGTLLGFATLLSFRVRRLARAAETALSPQGEIAAALPGQRARDELGALSRSFTDLLSRLREYTDYLRTLKGKLAHELRTPLAVVSTSLDNIEREPRGADLSPYFKRLREGSNRLNSIIDAMSEATAIEQAVADVTPEPFDLAAVVAECVGAYRDVYPERVFSLANRATRATVAGSPDLIAQMFDKLVDNAVSFSAPGSAIDIDLDERQDDVRLSVRNTGPLLPSTMRSQLFDSLVSIRKGGGERRHLGLGLYVAALIARAHGGRIEADNLDDGSGVAFCISLPFANAG